MNEGLQFINRSRSAIAMRANTSSQSPGADCRNTRIVGYQALFSPSMPQRHSGTYLAASHTGLASAPARCGIEVQELTTRSMSEQPLIDGQYFGDALSSDSGGTVQLVQGAKGAPTVTEIPVSRSAGCLLLAL